MPASQETLDTIALTRDEYDLIVQKLGREPNEIELGLFGALWSEHCGYKHSKPLLRTFPTTGASVQVEAGKENAGVVDIGEGLSIVFKAESHNHPSAVEPFQGAATGVGGIIRDILAMGARPIALLNSLRFGPLSDPRNRYLFDGVVRGISGYGNCIGIPNVGGEIQFADVYSGNPLVNVMCIGLLHKGELMSAAAKTPGSVLVAVGSATGRDGIHGASGLASRTFAGDGDSEMRPTVQVGDPFLEKVLVEACLEAAKSGHLEGLQDMGAAGLTSSAIECAERGGTGLKLNVDAVPRREEGMTAYDVMLSESQERMLLIVKEGHEDAIAEIFARWDLHVSNIGTVTDDGIVRIFEGGRSVAEVGVQTLVDAPQYRPGGTRPTYLNELHARKIPITPDTSQAGELLLSLLSSPNIASRRSVYRQYDHEVQTNTFAKPGTADAAVIRIRSTKKGIAVAIDGNGRQTYLEPYMGGAMAVAEACRNVVCTGATPVAITDCLNFGDPTKAEVYYQLEQAIAGMSAACDALGVPVISGNVSLFNESVGTAIYPTPVVGAVGLLNDISTKLTADFKSAGDLVLLLGTPGSSLAGSEYLAHIHGLVAGLPTIDLNAEALLQSLAVTLADQRLLQSAHDCSDGGLVVAVAESAILGSLGYSDAGLITSMTRAQAPPPRWDATLFGESPSRIVVTCSPMNLDTISERARESGVDITHIGTVGGDRFTIVGFIDEPLANLADVHGNGLERAIES
jgi:phosphoribosylformylglycinamidine synthase II